jgi:cytochrome c oxidase cbb3-type subunit 2
MKTSEVIAGAAGIVLFAGAVLALAPELQLGRQAPPEKLARYSPAEARGRQTYVDLGCVYCHSQQPRDRRQAPDGERGWGRASTPGDYAYDSPHLLGTMRTGPDLLNIGARQPSDDWHLLHLYQPRALTKGSIMPAYPFLFQEIADTALRPADVVVKVPAPYGPPAGRVVVASDEANDLVAYLKGLNRTYDTHELPSQSTTAPGTSVSSAQEATP